MKCGCAKLKGVDINDTIYKDALVKTEIDVEGEIKILLEMLMPAIEDRNATEKVSSEMYQHIKEKYQGILPYSILWEPINKVLEGSIKQREYDKKKNDFQAKMALNVYNKQMSEPVKGLGFSIITNDFISAATYVALSAYDTKKQLKKQENNALKTLAENLKQMNMSNAMYESDMFDAFRAVGDMMRMITRLTETKYFIAKHWDFYTEPEKYNLSQMLQGMDLYDIVTQGVACDCFWGSYSKLGAEHETKKAVLEAAGYIYPLGKYNYLTTTKYEQEVLQELYYREHPEEKEEKVQQTEKQKSQWYEDAKQMLLKEKYYEAAQLFQQAKGYKDALERSIQIWNEYILRDSVINIDLSRACACKSDGKIAYVDKDGEKLDWNHICQATLMFNGPVALTEEGRLQGTAESVPANGTSWNNIVQIANSEFHLVGLRSNGQVLALGNNEDGQCDVTSWTNVKKIAVALGMTMGLKEDGTVLLAGRSELCEQAYQTWRDIVDIEVSFYSALGRKRDGTVEAIGTEDYIHEVAKWHDVIRVKAVQEGVIGITKEGKVLYAGESDEAGSFLETHQNVVDVHNDDFDFWMLLHGDGTVSVKNAHYDISNWTDIVYATGTADYACGIKRDGTVGFVGKGRYDEGKFQEVSSWKLFEDINTLKRDKTETILNNIAHRHSLIQKEISELQKELSELKGLFVGKKKKELEQRIWRLKDEIGTN